MMRNKNKAPLLMTSHGEAFEKQTFYSLFENRHHTTSIPILSGKRVLGSGYGWLVLVDRAVDDDDDANCFLWNPETMEKIQLPRLHKSHLYNICVLSEPPTEPDCLVVFNKAHPTHQCICRIGDEKFVQFNTIETERAKLVAMSSSEGEIIGILDYGPHYEFAIIDLVGETGTVELTHLFINDEAYCELPQLRRVWVKQKNSYLIESPSGEFLFVTKLSSGELVEFRVFRVDLNEMKCSEELDNIDGLTIFIGHCGNGFCCASETAGSNSNSIYYTERRGRVVCVYDLDDRSTTELMPPSPVAHPHVSFNHWVDLSDSFLASA